MSRLRKAGSLRQAVRSAALLKQSIGSGTDFGFSLLSLSGFESRPGLLRIDLEPKLKQLA